MEGEGKNPAAVFLFFVRRCTSSSRRRRRTTHHDLKRNPSLKNPQVTTLGLFSCDSQQNITGFLVFCLQLCSEQVYEANQQINNVSKGEGSIEEAWFDSVAVFDSDCDDDYQSVPDGSSVSSFPSSRDANHRVSTKELSTGYSANISEAARSSDVQHCDGSIIEVNEPVFLNDISSVDANSNKDEGILDSCGILPNNCLPCLASTIPYLEKRRSSCSSPPDARKKAPMKLSLSY